MAPIDASGALRNWRPNIVLKRLAGRGWWEQRLTLQSAAGNFDILRPVASDKQRMAQLL